jgi:hypothetical protein
MLAGVLAAAAGPSPAPALALIGLGFFIGVGGHVARNTTAVIIGIGLIFVGSLLLPLVVYLSGPH